MLGFAFGLAVLVGNTIGVGILRTPGEVAARLPSVPLFMGVWVVGAAYALLGALTIAELAAMRPRSGGLYPLVADAIGGYAGFVAGWTDWLALAVASGAVALVLGEYALVRSSRHSPVTRHWSARRSSSRSSCCSGAASTSATWSSRSPAC